jgi:hypothetical protein
MQQPFDSYRYSCNCTVLSLIYRVLRSLFLRGQDTIANKLARRYFLAKIWFTLVSKLMMKLISLVVKQELNLQYKGNSVPLIKVEFVCSRNIYKWNY